MIDVEDLKILENSQEIFQNFDQNDIDTIANLMKKLKLKAGEFLFYEGMPATNLYIIKEGIMSISKGGFELSTLDEGKYIGEIAVIDEQARSASVSAKVNTTLYVIPLQILKEYTEVYAKLILNLSKVIAKRLRDTNQATVSALQNELSVMKLQAATGRLLSYILAAMACYVIGFRFILASFGENTLTSNSISVRVNIILALVILFIIRRNGYPLSSYGLNINNWKRAIWESIVFSIPIMIVIGIIRWVPWRTAIFGNGYNIANINLMPITQIEPSALLNLFIGYLLFVPVDEFIARGCLQESLQRFLIGRYSTLLAIFIASLLYSSIYSYLSPITSIIMLLLGIFWGWLYSRHRTIIGASISHMLIGIWISLLGFSISLI